MSAHSWYSCMRLANSLAATRVYAASRDSAFLIVNGGTHAERESGARAGPTPLCAVGKTEWNGFPHAHFTGTILPVHVLFVRFLSCLVCVQAPFRLLRRFARIGSSAACPPYPCDLSRPRLGFKSPR